MPVLRKIVDIILYASLFAVIIGLLLITARMRNEGRELISFSLVAALCALLMNFFVPARANKYALNRLVYRNNVILRNLSNAAAVCIIAGLVLRINDYPGGQFLRITGLLLFLVFLMGVLFAKNIRKKHSILNIPVIAVAPGDLDRYVGIYYNEQLKMHITVTKNETDTALVSQATNQASHPLNPIEKNIFNYDRAGIVVEFKPEENKFILIQNGGYFPFIKE